MDVKLTALPLEQRIKLVEDLWDSIAAELHALPLTAEQKAELDRRLDAYEADGNRGRLAADAIASIRALIDRTPDRHEDLTAMKSAKDEVRELLEQLPDDVSLDEVQYHIYIRQKVQRGLDAAHEGRVFTHDEVKRRMARWL